MKFNKSTTTKLKKGIFKDFIISLLVVAISFLPYLHDLKFFKGMEGFSGFSSLRIGLFFVLMFLVSLTGWVGWYLEAKGKRYRFAILAPIFMLAFQLLIYLFDARNTSTNEFTTKIIYNLVFALLIVMYYFYKKRK